MNTQIYPEKKTFSKFDEKRFIVYLNEKRANYLPSVTTSDTEESPEENIEPVLGYSYTGTMKDGGTLINANEASYSAFVAGLIRLLYSEDAESAIKSNMMIAVVEPGNPRVEEFREEWNSFQAYREQCKITARNLLS